MGAPLMLMAFGSGVNSLIGVIGVTGSTVHGESLAAWGQIEFSDHVRPG